MVSRFSGRSLFRWAPRRPDTPRIALAVCLCGNSEGLILEFETLLKSVLHNASARHAHDLYVIADDDASQAVRQLLERIHIGDRPWRVGIDVHVVNVQAQMGRWRAHLTSFVPRISETHSFGTFFRLFLDQVIGDRARHVIYTDTDVVFLAPLSGLWEQRGDRELVSWGRSRCAGVMILDVAALGHDFWTLAGESIEADQHYDDQQILRAVHDSAPERFRWLTPAWDMHLADGLWRYRDELPEHRPQAGYLHFNGGGASTEAYFRHDPTWAFQTRGWNLASYYVGLPWSWLYYMGEVGAKEIGSRDRITVSYEVA